MRRLLVGAAGAAAAFAVHAAPSEAACIEHFDWHGYAYYGVGSQAERIGEALALPARQPSCNDTVGPDGPQPVTYTDKTVYRLKGVEPSIALTDGRSTFINQGTFPALKSHPLNPRIGGWGKWRYGAGERCQVKGPAKIDATGLYVDGRKIVVVARTKVELQRHGTGFVPPEAMVRVGGTCVKRTGGRVWLKASRITRA